MAYTEEDTKLKFITPALEKVGWDIRKQIKMEYQITDGRIIVKDKEDIQKTKPKKADYVLYYKEIPLAIIEAKKYDKQLSEGIQQAIDYGKKLDVPFVYSSNGKGFYEHDFITGNERELKDFPTPQELYNRYNLTKKVEQVLTQKPYNEKDGKHPRYYQEVAINKTLKAVANGEKKILLVMATGTGKTFTAFQIIWRLRKSKTKKRFLFLADRNILIDQTINNDFAPFGNAMTKIVKRRVNKSYEIYLCLYQAITGTDEEKNIYKQFDSNFFDLIIIDECHRGSANQDSSWHEVLDYFSSATHIGLTATPKETNDISTTKYFGEPIYTYSLKQGIEDGFLAPYQVIRCNLNKDITGWRPQKYEKDKNGEIIEDKEYTLKEYDRTIFFKERMQVIAEKIMSFKRDNDDIFGKSIVFCESTEHALNMRNAINNEAKQNEDYVVRITGDDTFGKDKLKNFQDVESHYPVIATTSQLLSTGVDIKDLRLIVLDKNINSITEFKQIIGRGTRLFKDLDKYYFTIIDFRGATKLFADPEFDGEPVKIINDGEPVELEMPLPILDESTKLNEPTEPIYIKKIYIERNVGFNKVMEETYYLDKNGKLIKEEMIEENKKVVLEKYKTAQEFIDKWNESNKDTIINDLTIDGFSLKDIEKEYKTEYDIYDLILKNVYNLNALTKEQRYNNAMNYINNLTMEQQKVFEAILEYYKDNNIFGIETLEILDNLKNIGRSIEIIEKFGSKEKYQQISDKVIKSIYGGICLT